MSTGRLLDRDGRSLKERLKDYVKGSDNYSRMGDARKKPEKPKKKKPPMKKPEKGGKPKPITTKNPPGGPYTPGAKAKDRINK
jgi:hypothetical protein